MVMVEQVYKQLGLAFGGYTGTVNTAVTEEYNGTSWTTSTSMTTARAQLGNCGTQTSALRIWWLYINRCCKHRRIHRIIFYR
jgi:hypothetical protein